MPVLVVSCRFFDFGQLANVQKENADYAVSGGFVRSVESVKVAVAEPVGVVAVIDWVPVVLVVACAFAAMA